METELVSSFFRMARRMREGMVMKNFDFEEISKAEFGLLMHIDLCKKQFNVVTTSILSKSLSISKPAVSQMISSLESKKFVSREIHEEDKRLTCINITDEGVEILLRLEALMASRIKSVLDKMGKEESETLIKLLEKFYSIATSDCEKS